MLALDGANDLFALLGQHLGLGGQMLDDTGRLIDGGQSGNVVDGGIVGQHRAGWRGQKLGVGG